MNVIVTSARSTSNAVRSHPFPVLEAGNISFPKGRYTLEFILNQDRTSFKLRHRIAGANLISRLLSTGKARYVCTVSSPISSYRRTHVSSEALHTIDWDLDDLGEPPLFTPMIVGIEDLPDCLLSAREDGVHEIWDMTRVSIPKGSRLALGQVIQFQSSILHLMSLQVDEGLSAGQFYVDAETEHGFQFRVSLHPELHQFLQIPRNDGIRRHIMTHIVTACLALLQREFQQDPENGSLPRNLDSFRDFLKNDGLPDWSESRFRPEEVATKLYPHVLPTEWERAGS